MNREPLATGLVLDNCQTGLDQAVDPHGYDKLVAMGARLIGMLWTGGTRHGRDVYERCEALLDRPRYLVRVGGHRQTADQWLPWLAEALAQVPAPILDEHRVLFAVGNEGNIEFGDAAEYGVLYRTIVESKPSVPVLFACPSLGIGGWEQWLERAVATAGPIERLIVNLYDDNVAKAQHFTRLASEVWVGEVNTLRDGRSAWLRGAFQQLADAGVHGALVFIAGGKSDGAWDERYVITQEDAVAIRGLYIATDQGGEGMAWDRHQEFDQWNRAFGGQGYNPNDAWGQIRAQHPEVDYGPYVGPYRDHGDLMTGWTTVGIFWYDRRNGAAGFATVEEELPNGSPLA